MISCWNYFPTQIFRDEVPQLVDRVLETFDEMFDNTEQGYSAIPLALNSRCMTGSSQLMSYQRPITDYIRDTSISILKSQGYDTYSHDIYIESLWAQILPTGAYHSSHIHSNSVLSGVYMLTGSEETSSHILFDDARAGKAMSDMPLTSYDNILPATSQVVFKDLLPGSILFFNSFTPHSFTPNYSSKSVKFLHFCINFKKK